MRDNVTRILRKEKAYLAGMFQGLHGKGGMSKLRMQVVQREDTLGN